MIKGEEIIMNSLCGADCSDCGYGKGNGCKGCEATDGCPFGKQCFIHSYIKTGGLKSFEQFKLMLMGEFNGLGVPGMPKITELYALNGAFVNLAYPMPNGEKVKLLDDNAVYLGNQVCCEFDDGDGEKCFGLVAGMDFLLVAEYGENCADPELLVFMKR